VNCTIAAPIDWADRGSQRFGWGSDEVARFSLLSGPSHRDQPSLHPLKSVGEDRKRHRRDTAEIIDLVGTDTRTRSNASILAMDRLR